MGKKLGAGLRNEGKCNDGHDSRLAVPLAYQLLPSVKKMLYTVEILNAEMVQNHSHILDSGGGAGDD